MLPKLVLALAPIGVLMTAAFGAFHLYAAAVAVRLGNWPFVLFYAVFGVGGFAIATALWRVRQRLRATRGS